MKGDIYKKCAGCVTCASVSGQGTREQPAVGSPDGSKQWWELICSCYTAPPYQVAKGRCHNEQES